MLIVLLFDYYKKFKIIFIKTIFIKTKWETNFVMEEI